MNTALPKRSEVEPALTWRLEDIYETEQDWEKDYSTLGSLCEEFAAKKGCTASAKALLDAFTAYEKMTGLIDHLYGYAHMKNDEDKGNTHGQELIMKAQAIYARMGQASAPLMPELIALSEETLNQYYEEEPGLSRYRLSITEMRRLKPHMLDAERELMLAQMSEMAGTAANTYSILENADLKFPEVENEKGEKLQLTNGRFVPMQSGTDRVLRKNAFTALYETYKSFVNTWASLYDGQVKKQIFFARVRKYPSSFEAAVDANQVSPKVCENLIESVHRHLGSMHRYVSLRKKMLGVSELHMYDVYAPMVKEGEKTISFEEAKAISLKALAPLGEEYIKLLKEAYDNRWIDVVENEGKRSGAYSSGVYGVHPYVLLNYQNTLDDVFTLVHEMGHSLHTWYSNHAQNILDADYKIFVAEVASTTNEVLLLEYLLKQAKTPQEEAVLVNHYLENFKGTLYRQTMFAEFEKKTNASAEEGNPLTAELLCQTYAGLNEAYFGPDMVSDDLIRYEWCRIPHFYYNFYVYQYATSFAASVSIAHRILKDPSVVKDYLAFLSGGCTKDPVSLLKIAGVDLSTAAPIDEALEVFDQALDRMETLWNEHLGKEKA